MPADRFTQFSDASTSSRPSRSTIPLPPTKSRRLSHRRSRSGSIGNRPTGRGTGDIDDPFYVNDDDYSQLSPYDPEYKFDDDENHQPNGVPSQRLQASIWDQLVDQFHAGSGSGGGSSGKPPNQLTIGLTFFLLAILVGLFLRFVFPGEPSETVTEFLEPDILHSYYLLTKKHYRAIQPVLESGIANPPRYKYFEDTLRQYCTELKDLAKSDGKKLHARITEVEDHENALNEATLRGNSGPTGWFSSPRSDPGPAKYPNDIWTRWARSHIQRHARSSSPASSHLSTALDDFGKYGPALEVVSSKCNALLLDKSGPVSSFTKYNLPSTIRSDLLERWPGDSLAGIESALNTYKYYGSRSMDKSKLKFAREYDTDLPDEYHKKGKGEAVLRNYTYAIPTLQGLSDTIQEYSISRAEHDLKSAIGANGTLSDLIRLSRELVGPSPLSWLKLNRPSKRRWEQLRPIDLFPEDESSYEAIISAEETRRVLEKRFLALKETHALLLEGIQKVREQISQAEDLKKKVDGLIEGKGWESIEFRASQGGRVRVVRYFWFRDDLPGWLGGNIKQLKKQVGAYGKWLDSLPKEWPDTKSEDQVVGEGWFGWVSGMGQGEAPPLLLDWGDGVDEREGAFPWMAQI